MTTEEIAIIKRNGTIHRIRTDECRAIVERPSEAQIKAHRKRIQRYLNGKS